MSAAPKAVPTVQRVEGVAKTALVLQNSRLTPEQIELLKKTVAKNATDDEFALFIELCNHTGLNPFARQIYCLERRTKNQATQQWERAMVTQVGIDGFRLIADRSEKYRGQTPPLYADAAGNWREVWIDKAKPPLACKVGVVKEGFSEPLYAIALYDEYVQRTAQGSPNAMWKGKPTVMLAKCAEAMALRKAFPQELSGLYTEDELPNEIEDTPQQLSATSTASRRVDPGASATAHVDNDGDVVITFGRLKDQKMRLAPTSALIEMFRDPWMDDERKAVAEGRLGKGFVISVEEELRRRGVSDTISLDQIKLVEKFVQKKELTDDETLALAQLSEDHPGVSLKQLLGIVDEAAPASEEKKSGAEG